tara:strand:+ start:180 stop:815 length:636 start_codon:yes stop_codon:yes gene_type:complete
MRNGLRTLTAVERHELNINYVTAISYPIEDEFTVTVRISETKMDATLSYKRQSGTRTLIGVSDISSYGPRKEIKPSQLSLPLVKIRNEVTTLIQELSDSVSVTIRPETIKATASVSSGVLSTPYSKDRKRKTTTETDLLDIAVRYNAYEGAKGCQALMAEESALSVSQIRKLLVDARKAGLLEPTAKGKKNWNLTPKAKRLMTQITKAKKG